jgi:hypothetical protein
MSLFDSLVGKLNLNSILWIDEVLNLIQFRVNVWLTMNVNVFCEMDFSMYPRDKHVCPFHFGSRKGINNKFGQGMRLEHLLLDHEPLKTMQSHGNEQK